MKRFPCSLLLVSLLCACTATPWTTGAPMATKIAANAPVEPLGGLSFKPLSADNARYASAGGGSAVSNSGGLMPTVVPSASALSPAGGPMSGNMDGYYGGSPFGNSSDGGPTALVSLTETETTGSSGPFTQMVKQIAAPILKDWAPDARLITSSGPMANDGRLPQPTPSAADKGMAMPFYYGGELNWRFTYLSPSRRETLQFIVSPAKTLVLRTRWAPLVIDPAAIAVDSDAAVQKLIAAIETPSFRGEEEKSGTDYFLGTPFGATGAAVSPTPSDQPRVEVIYDVPEQARWNATLQSIMGKLVWEMSFYGPPEMIPNPEPNASPYIPKGQTEYQFDNSARGMVDAETGAVIRFSRPAKRYFPTYPQPIPGRPLPPDMMPSIPPPPPAPIPYPMPSA